MRDDPSVLGVAPRYVVEISFTTDYSDLVYFTSHTEAQTPAAATVYSNVIADGGISGTTQKLNTREGRATIGNLSIKMVDKSEQLTSLFNTKLEVGRGLREKRVRVYIGYDDDVWSDYTLIQTQIVERLEFNKGEYNLVCSDIQRSERKEIFRLAETNLQSSISATDTTITVYNTSDFETMEHSTSFTDAPSSTVGYIRIEDEIIRYTGKTDTTFTGCVRGVLNTLAVAHNVDTSQTADRRPEVIEVVYLEMPAAKLAYAIMTGVLYGQGGAELPSNWHLGISTDWVRLSDFTGIGEDVWDTSDDTLGHILRFVGIEETDGKKFIEKDVLFPIMFSPVYPTGELGLKRLTGVLTNAAYDVELNEDNVTKVGMLKHDMKDVVNQIEVGWNWNADKQKLTRHNYLIDATSITMHQAAPLEKIELRGLHGSRHTINTITWVFDTWRDRYSGPPIKTKVGVLPSHNVIEVGDIVRLNINTLRDSSAGVSIDRSFEVQGVSINWMTGQVSLDLFGSSQKADAVQTTTDNTILGDTDYEVGNDLTAYLDPADYTEVGGLLRITSDVSLAGATDVNAGDPGNYYYVGDLQIDAGVTVSIDENVRLWVAGNIQVNGSIVSTGGITGVVKSTSRRKRGTAGVLGVTQAQGYVVESTARRSAIRRYWHEPALVTRGAYAVIPEYNIEYDSDAGTLLGLPGDLRGTSGGPGGNLGTTWNNWDPVSNHTRVAYGGDGGDGGAGLHTVSRGVSFGASGSVDLSGEDGSASGALYTSYLRDAYAGAGAGGAPGGWLVVLDGTLANAPDDSKFTALNGSTPTKGYRPSRPTFYKYGTGVYNHNDLGNGWSNYYRGITSTRDSSQEHFRITYIKSPETASQDVDEGVLPAVSGLALASGTEQLFTNADGTVIARIYVSWTAATDQRVIGYEYQYKLSSASDWSGLTTTLDTSGYIFGVESGSDYDVRIRTLDSIGNYSAWTSVTDHTVVGKTAAPSDVPFLLVNSTAATTTLKWGAITDLDLKGYEVRYGTQGAATWATGIRLTAGLVTGTQISTADIPSGSWTFMVKAKDTSGNYSENAATYNYTVTAPTETISSVQEAPDFGGTLTNIYRTWNGRLIPDGSATVDAEGWETFDEFSPNPAADCYIEIETPVSFGFDSTVRAYAVIEGEVPPTGTGDFDPILQIDYFLDGGSYDGYEDWTTGSVTAETIKARIDIDTTICTPVIDGFRFVIDGLTREESDADVSIGASGTTITFAEEFHNIPFLDITVLGTSAASYSIESLGTTSFIAHVYDSGGTEVGGTINWRATGV